MTSISSMASTNSGGSTNDSQVVLHYYPFRGVAQPIRILLNYLKVEYYDNYVQKNEQNQIETGFRVGLPMLEDGNFKVNQQISIMNYLCMKYNQQSLLGLTPQHSAKINELCFKYSAQKKKIYSNILQGLKYLEDPNSTKNEMCQKSLKKIIEESKFVQVCLKKLSKTQNYIFEYLTIVDFLFYEICFYIEGFYKDLITKNSEYYGIIKFKHEFEKNNFYKKNKQRLEQNSLFYEFSMASMNMIISKHWKGSGIQNIFAKKDFKGLKRRSYNQKSQKCSKGMVKE